MAMEWEADGVALAHSQSRKEHAGAKSNNILAFKKPAGAGGMSSSLLLDSASAANGTSIGFSGGPLPSSATMEALTTGIPCTMHAYDLQNFDEATNVELHQLFPPSLPHPSHMNTLATTTGMYQPAQGNVNSSSASSLEYFPESFQSFYGEGAHDMTPFGFAVNHAPYFDDRPGVLTSGTGCLSTHAAPSHQITVRNNACPKVSMPASGMMQVMSDSMVDLPGSFLGSSASVTTPPTAPTVPRALIVSPANAYAASRFDDVEAQNIVDTPKFSPDRRKLCCVEGCKSQARAFNRCKRHGGSKRCSHPGCTKSVQSRGLCIRHGGGSRCQESGCTRAAQSHGRCKMHGGGRPCIVEGCEKKAHLKRLCRKHGGGAKCSLPGCDKWAQRQGMCMTHSKHMSPTSVLPVPPRVRRLTPPAPPTFADTNSYL